MSKYKTFSVRSQTLLMWIQLKTVSNPKIDRTCSTTYSLLI